MRDLTAVKDALKKHQIELPSWAFGNSGTRFKVFGQPGVPRNPYEKADDAAQVHKYTGVAPIMAVHIPWDKVDDYEALSAHAKGNGIRIGAVNSNVFQDDDYKLGSVAHPDPRVRAKALAHLPDWGTAVLHCQALGDQAQVVVDTGHHAPGVNIEFIVAMQLKARKLGGFNFNSRFYADDDLMVGAADPFQLFRIMHEVVKADALTPAAGVAYSRLS